MTDWTQGGPILYKTSAQTDGGPESLCLRMLDTVAHHPIDITP